MLSISPSNATIVTSRVFVRADSLVGFANWQAQLNSAIAAFPGFVSLEILSPSLTQPEWLIVQRFYTPEDLHAWQH